MNHNTPAHNGPGKKNRMGVNMYASENYLRLRGMVAPAGYKAGEVVENMGVVRTAGKIVYVFGIGWEQTVWFNDNHHSTSNGISMLLPK